MRATTSRVKIISITSRDVPGLKAGDLPTKFLSLTVFDGTRNEKMWAFGHDFPNPPLENASGTFEVLFRAKAGSYGPYLSVRAIAFNEFSPGDNHSQELAGFSADLSN